IGQAAGRFAQHRFAKRGVIDRIDPEAARVFDSAGADRFTRPSRGPTMRRLAIAIVAGQLIVAGARANDMTMMIAGGQCLAAQVASQSIACGPPPKIVYVALPNGIIIFNVGLADGRVYGFVGDRDFQPKPESYELFLKRIRLARVAEGVT